MWAGMGLVSLNVSGTLDFLLTDVISLPSYYMYVWSSCSTVTHINVSPRCFSAVLRQVVYLLSNQIRVFDRALHL